MKTIKAVLLSVFLGIALALSGCSALQTHAGSTTLKLAAVEYVTKAEDPQARADRVRDVVGKIDAHIADPGVKVSIVDLENYARAQVDWQNKTIAQRLLIDELIVAVRADLAERLGPTVSVDSPLTEADIAIARYTFASILQGVALTGY